MPFTDKDGHLTKAFQNENMTHGTTCHTWSQCYLPRDTSELTSPIYGYGQGQGWAF